MAKRVNSFNCKGMLNLEEGLVHEIKKEEEILVKFFDILKEFDGRTVSITIKEETELGNEEFEGDDE